MSVDPKPLGPASTAGPPTRPAETDPDTTPSLPDSQPFGDGDGLWEETEPSSWRLAFRTVPAWLVSLIFHLALLLVLGLCTFADEVDLEGVFVSASTTDAQEESLEDFVEVELEAIQELDELAQADLTTDIADVGVIALGDLSVPAEIETGGDIGELELPATTIDEIGALFGGEGNGMADIGEGLKAAAVFFGAKSSGDEFVFVVDNSNSMTRGRFETAMIELMRTVNAMSPRQKFYVIFFSDTAYRMFHPEPAPTLVPATEENKLRLQRWIGTVQLCLRTDGEAAMQIALSLEPDVIYILGDGAFTDKTTQKLTAPHNRRIPIQTLGMEVDSKGALQLQAIAQANGGTYRLVGTSPEARMMAQRNPIKRNNVRGPIWGIELPLTAGPKKNAGPKKKKRR